MLMPLLAQHLHIVKLFYKMSLTPMTGFEIVRHRERKKL